MASTKSKKAPVGASTFSKKITKGRAKSGLTQKQVAELVGVSPKEVSKWEKGAKVPTFDVAIAAAEKLDVALPKSLLLRLPVVPSEAPYGTAIRTAREAVGLSQRELGVAIGSGQPTVSKWESDDRAPSDDYRAKLEGTLPITFA